MFRKIVLSTLCAIICLHFEIDVHVKSYNGFFGTKKTVHETGKNPYGRKGKSTVKTGKYDHLCAISSGTFFLSTVSFHTCGVFPHSQRGKVNLLANDHGDCERWRRRRARAHPAEVGAVLPTAAAVRRVERAGRSGGGCGPVGRHGRFDRARQPPAVDGAVPRHIPRRYEGSSEDI